MLYVCCKCKMIACISEEEGWNKVEQGVVIESGDVFVCLTPCFIAKAAVVAKILSILSSNHQYRPSVVTLGL